MVAINAKFSTFVDGGDAVVGDIIVGLRDGLNTRFTFNGVPNTYLPLLGGTMQGAIDMNTNGITGLPTPSGGTDAANKSYVDSVAGGLVDSVTGTANQVDVNNTDPANPILSLSATINCPGTFNIQTTTAIDKILDEDNMASDSATALATQQSIKAYVDATVSTSFMWSTISGTTQAAAVNNGYFANNAGLVTVTLPATAAIGTRVIVAGQGAGGWRLAANAGQTIIYSAVTTSSGGSFSSTHQSDTIEVVCQVANTTWQVLSSVSVGLTVA